MSKPVLYLFNGKVARFGSGVLGFTPPEPPTFDSVQIGDQIWMSKNLAIDDGGEGISTRTVNYGQGDVVETYYTWNAAVRVSSSVPGWHLPTSTEFDALVSYIGSNAGQKLKSTYGWTNNGNGTDEFGFTALPTGCYLSSGYKTFGERTSFWSSTIGSSVDYPDAYSLFNSMNTVLSGTGSKTNGYSVRLIKDS